MSLLKRLEPSAARGAEAFIRGEEEPDFEAVALPLKRDDGPDIKLDPLETVVSQAMTRFEDERTKADAWLAPRLHALLRLTRREAADPGIWLYLALSVFPKYVRWRHVTESGEGEGDTRSVYFTGPAHEQAFSRLWWMAELIRNGDDYAPAVSACRYQDLYKFTPYRLLRHRPTALALACYLEDVKGRKGGGRKDEQTVPRRLNLAVVTNILDSIAPYAEGPPDEAWMHARTPDREACIENPVGPRQGRVPAADIEACLEFIKRIAGASPRPADMPAPEVA